MGIMIKVGSALLGSGLRDYTQEKLVVGRVHGRGAIRGFLR